MSAFPQLLRSVRNEFNFTQTEFATYLNHLDDEFNAIDVVTVNRWENNKVKPSNYKALKILDRLGVDLSGTLRSFELEEKENLIDDFLYETFFSYQSRIASLSNLNTQEGLSGFRTIPLMSTPSDIGIIHRIKLISYLTKVDTAPLNAIDLFLHYKEQKAHGRKVINEQGDIVSHNLGFFFENDNFDIYKTKKIDLKLACSLKSNKDLNYVLVSSHSEEKRHAVANIISDIRLLSKHNHIKRFTVLIEDPNEVKALKAIGFEVFKFSDPSQETANITFKSKSYHYCILTIDKIDFLTNRHVISFIKGEFSTMRAFPALLKEVRKNLKLTQKDFAAHINHLDDEFNSVDVVTVNRWENNKVKPSNYKALKILDCLGVDLYETLKSFEIDDLEDNTLLDEFLNERFYSFQSRIASIANVNNSKEYNDFQVMPLMSEPNDRDIIDRIKLISQFTKVDPSALDTIDLYLYCAEKKAFGRKLVNNHGDIVSHSLGFFFNEELFDEYKKKDLHIKQACSLDSNQNLNYFVVSAHSEKQEHSIVNMLSDMQLLAKNNKIKRFSMLIKNPYALDIMKKIGFEIYKFSEPTEERSNIEFKNQSYRYCILTIDKIELLSNKHVTSFINKHS